jgi:phage-related protein
MSELKPLHWIGSAKKDLAAMPEAVQDFFGYALLLAQKGSKHNNAKPLTGFGGAGVLEVVDIHHGDAYRAVYTVRFAKAVYVLHCFRRNQRRGSQPPSGKSISSKPAY